jgi:CarboxypepD_reg-like domain
MRFYFHRFAIIFSLLLLLPVSLFAQKKVTLSGFLRDAESGETLVAANVYVKEINFGVQTNAYGFYSVSMTPGTYTVVFSYVGYSTVTESITINESRAKTCNIHS